LWVLHGILGGKQGLRRSAKKSRTRKKHESATNSIAKRGQGGTPSLFICPLQGQGGTSSLFVCPLWGLGHRPNCSSSDQSQGSRQQRRRQRSVPASNFARPQTRPQAAFPPRFHEEPFYELDASVVEELHRHVSAAEGYPHADFRLLRLHNLRAGAR
jgi:hypothetical protein